MAGLLYGSGFRLMESVPLRVKDIDFGYARITVRGAKHQMEFTKMSKSQVQSKPTPTITQSGLLAVLLRRQHDKVIELAERGAQRRKMRFFLSSALTRLLARARAGSSWPTIRPGLSQARNHVSPNPHLRRASATDSRRPAVPTSPTGCSQMASPPFVIPTRHASWNSSTF